MTKAYQNNPYYNLLVFFLIKYRLYEVRFKKNLLVRLETNAQQEILDILNRNKRLTLMEKHKPSFANKKVIDTSNYCELERQNAELLHNMIGIMLEKKLQVSPAFNYEIPTLTELCARTLSVYATTQTLFSDKRAEINGRTKKIRILEKKQPWYSNIFFGKSYLKSPQDIPKELFDKVISIYKSKTKLQKIIEKYQSINKHHLAEKFNFNDVVYFNLIANFLLGCTIYKNNTSFIKVLEILDNDNNPDIFHPLSGITPLHIACELDAPIVLVEQLITNGCKVHHAQNFANITPLYRACMFNASEKLINFLLQHGAKISAIAELANCGTNALHIACHFGYDELALLLLKNGANMHEKVRVSKLLDYEEYYYYCNANALHLALKAGCQLAAQYMIENNSDFSQVTKGKVHVFHLACQYGTLFIVKALGDKLKNFSIEDADKLNPADYALMNSVAVERTKILVLLKSVEIIPTKSKKEVEEILSNRSGIIDYGFNLNFLQYQ